MKTENVEKYINDIEREQTKLRENLKTTLKENKKENDTYCTEIKMGDYTPDWQVTSN